jgi:hypothetical protein
MALKLWMNAVKTEARLQDRLVAIREDQDARSGRESARKQQEDDRPRTRPSARCDGHWQKPAEKLWAASKVPAISLART